MSTQLLKRGHDVSARTNKFLFRSATAAGSLSAAAIAEKGESMRKAINVGAAVAIAATMGLMAGAGTASAATTVIQPRFAAQAHAGGISVAQADKLQQEVTSYIHEHGGAQAALNVVDFPGGSITFAVPGEKYARDLATTHRPLAAAVACNAGAFCAYANTSYKGSEISSFNNCQSATMPWVTEGSYINQLPAVSFPPVGGTDVWYNAKNVVLYITPPSNSRNPAVNWGPVAYTNSCER
jgi:hypothetical protein